MVNQYNYINDLSFRTAARLLHYNKSARNLSFSSISLANELYVLSMVSTPKIQQQIVYTTGTLNLLRPMMTISAFYPNKIECKLLMAHSDILSEKFKTMVSSLLHMQCVSMEGCNKPTQIIKEWLKKTVTTPNNVDSMLIPNFKNDNLLLSTTSIMNLRWVGFIETSRLFFSKNYLATPKQVNSIRIEFDGSVLDDYKYNLTMVTIPLDDAGFEAVLIMPSPQNSIKSILGKLKGFVYRECRTRLVNKRIKLEIPLFSIANTFINTFNLFKSMGIKLKSKWNNSLDNRNSSIIDIDAVYDVNSFGISFYGLGSDVIVEGDSKLEPPLLSYHPNDCITVNRPFIYLLHYKPLDCIVQCCVIVDPYKNT